MGSSDPVERFGHDAWLNGAVPVLALEGWGIAVPQGLTMIGRQGRPGDAGPDVDLSSFDTAQLVSRHHAEIRYAGGVLSVRDLESANGTRVQGMTLLPHRDYPLEPGDLVVLGDVTLRVIAVRAAGEQFGGAVVPTAARTGAPAGVPAPGGHDPVTERRPAVPVAAPVVGGTVPESAPQPLQPVLNPNATIVPTHHLVEEEQEQEKAASSGPLGAVANRLRRRNGP